MYCNVSYYEKLQVWNIVAVIIHVDFLWANITGVVRVERSQS